MEKDTTYRCVFFHLKACYSLIRTCFINGRIRLFKNCHNANKNTDFFNKRLEEMLAGIHCHKALIKSLFPGKGT